MITAFSYFLISLVLVGIVHAWWQIHRAYQRRRFPEIPDGKPDYAYIARLERELGIGDPPPEGGPFIRHVPAGRAEEYAWPAAPVTGARSAGLDG